MAEEADVGRERAGEAIADEIEDAERGERGGNAGRDRAGDLFPIGED